MGLSRLFCRTAGACATLVMLAACAGTSGVTPPTVTSGARSASVTASDAQRRDLVYVSDAGTGSVHVYSYPQGADEGTLTGFTSPGGECADKAGDVFITDSSASVIREYAHGGTIPIAVLSDAGYEPWGCSVDPTSGDLAVTNLTITLGEGGDVAVFTQAKSKRVRHYTNPYLNQAWYCGYDNKGNLFVDGRSVSNTFSFAVLRSGGARLESVSLDQTIGAPGGVQWDGKYVTVGDATAASSSKIYRFTIRGKQGMRVATTRLGGAKQVYQYWIDGDTVIGPDFGAANVMFWKYPQASDPFKTIGTLSEPVGATVSHAQ